MARIKTRLTALTDDARTALKGSECLEINCFPFLIGRNERIRISQGKEYVAERRQHNGPPVNHCYLVENHKPMYISRAHFALDHLGGNEFTLIDRNSACGTIVAGVQIGGRDKGGRIDLKSGQTIQIGSSASPYLFRFEVEDSTTEDPGHIAWVGLPELP
jgi:pSer/pThr/pTyr-binding forkhead associated (FHA) protein